MSKTIMVVDDDESIVDVIKIILEEKQFSVIPVRESSTLDTVLSTSKPDLILLDIWMDGMDGAQITKKLKGNESTRQIPIIMISANNKVGEIAKEAGVDGFLAKPFNIEDLLQIVEKYTVTH